MSNFCHFGNERNKSIKLLGVFWRKNWPLSEREQDKSRQIKQRERPKGKQVQSEPEHQGQVVGGGIGHHEDVS